MKNKKIALLLLFLPHVPSLDAKRKIIYRLSAPQPSSTPTVRNGPEMISMAPESVITCLKHYLPNNPAIVVTRAFDGYDTKKISSAWPLGKIYAFEPEPDIYTELEKNILLSPNITACPTGNKDNNTQPSLDEWALHNNISYVDLLWLDMQGFELGLLQECPKLLTTVHAIYTEVDFTISQQGQHLYHEVKPFLEQQGFTLVARDFEEPATYSFGNAIFVKK